MNEKRCRVLLIVDAQPLFSSHQKALPGILKSIDQAKKANFDCIVVMEYVRYGPTVPSVREAIGTYPHKMIRKFKDDGGGKFLIAMGNVEEMEVYICGVNGCCCVRATAETLTRCGAEVSLITDGIWCYHGANWLNQLRKTYWDEDVSPFPEMIISKEIK